MASIYVIRHGQASFGAANYDQLSPLGQRQADVTGEFCKTIGLDFDYAVSGNLSRQRETGERVLAHQGKHVQYDIDPRFNEINNDEQIEKLLPVICEQNEEIAALKAAGFKSSKDYQKVIDAVFNLWVSPDCPDVGIQPWSEFRDGVQAALGQVMKTAGGGTNSAVFTSGGTIATIMGLVLGSSADQFYGFYEPVFNCSISRFIFSSKRISMSNFNDVGHLRLLSAQLGEELVTYR